MLLALLSDTHDNARSTQAALALLAPHHPAAYLHAGDLVSPQMLEHFAHLPVPFHFILGNNEFDPPALHAAAAARGLHFHHDFADLSFAGKRLAMTHGHDGVRLEKLIASGHYAWVIHGHTHQQRDERRGATRVLNPGALHRARIRSVALLDPAADALTFLHLPPSA